MMIAPSSFRVASLALALMAAATGTARAQSPTRASGKEYALTQSSSFDAPPGGTRSPFWPIGWVPTASAAPVQVSSQALDVKGEQFVVTTISVDYPPLAIINGRNYAVGDQIPVTADKREYVTVKQILDGVVVLDYHGRELRSNTVMAGAARKAK